MTVLLAKGRMNWQLGGKAGEKTADRRVTAEAMTDYWKSNEKHYCKYCNVWIQSDKNSIRHHEQGGRHKGMVEAALKQKRKEKSNAFHEERDLQQQLREIEEAAHAKYVQDLAASGIPPPPPPRPSHHKRPPHSGKHENGRRGGDRQHSNSNRQEDEPLEEEPPKEDDKGIYVIRGAVYLEGKRHEDQLLVGSACQIWVEELEEWLDALIEKAVATQVPNTDLSFRRFSVTYMHPDSSTPVTEQELSADRLRIKLPSGMTLEDAQRMVDKLASGEAETIEEAHVVVDETTGMGEWSTVVVHTIDESEEAVAQRAAEAELEEAKRLEEEKSRDALDDFSSHGDNALGAFNPWGGTYKGIDLENETAGSRKAREEEIMIEADGDVSFKKRRATAPDSSGPDKAKKKKQRRIRSEDGD